MLYVPCLLNGEPFKTCQHFPVMIPTTSVAPHEERQGLPCQRGRRAPTASRRLGVRVLALDCLHTVMRTRSRDSLGLASLWCRMTAVLADGTWAL